MAVVYSVNRPIHPYCSKLCIKMEDGKLVGFGCNALLLASLILNEMH